MLERGDRPEQALRILRRYTTEDRADAAGWRAWLEANRSRLFFTDVGGFKFLIAPDSLARPPAPAPGPPRGPDAEHPVVAAAELSPARVKAGDSLSVVVRVAMAPAWHIYAVGGSRGPGVPTTLELRLPEGIEAEGEWAYPEPVRGTDGQMVHEGTVEFRRRLRAGADAAPGPIVVTCEFGYQACDPSSCRPPTRLEVGAKGEIVIAPGPEVSARPQTGAARLVCVRATR
jgi:hypothetical protein